MHIVSNVEAQVREDEGPVSVLKATLRDGALDGEYSSRRGKPLPIHAVRAVPGRPMPVPPAIIARQQPIEQRDQGTGINENGSGHSR